MSGLWVHQQALPCRYRSIIFVGSLCWRGKGDPLSMEEVAVTLEVWLQHLIVSVHPWDGGWHEEDRWVGLRGGSEAPSKICEWAPLFGNDTMWEAMAWENTVGRKSQAFSRAMGNTLKVKKRAVLENRSTVTRMAAFPCEGTGLLWNPWAWAATAWVGVERVFKSPWGLCRGLWCGCRSHRLRCNQLWATGLPGWSGVVSSSSPRAWLWVHRLGTGVCSGPQAVYGCLLQVWKDNFVL